MKNVLKSLLLLHALLCCINQVYAHPIISEQAKTTEDVQSGSQSNNTRPPQAISEKGSHLLFMGIPIDGNIEAFDQKLSDKGFTKSSLGDYSGRFYGQFCLTDTKVDKNTGNVCEVFIRYNQLIAKYSETQLINLYDNIVRDLKKKYSTAKRDETGGSLVLSMPLGYIECKLFRTIFGQMGGGVNLTIRYVDKKNSSDYHVPTLKRNEDDL